MRDRAMEPDRDAHLLPMLFALTLEPIALWIRKEMAQWGIKVWGVNHLVSLYADSTLFYL